MNRLIIKNATLCDHRGTQKSDLEIEKGIITQIAPCIHGENEFDATSLIALPACIDLNVHPKHYTQKDFSLLKQKALLGGVGTLALPCPPQFLELFNFFNTQSPIRFLPNLIPFFEEKICDISIMQNLGSVSLCLNTTLKSQELDCLYAYAKMLHLPCTCSFNPTLQCSAFESEMSYKMGLSMLPHYFEHVEFSRLLPLITHYKVSTIIQALSNLALFQQVQHLPDVFSEISIHHLLLNETYLAHYNTWAKLSPPLLNQATQEQFLNSITQIDMLTSLHREFSQNSKEQTFEDAQEGVDCLEFYFPLLYTKLVKTQILSLEELSAKTSYHQAKFLRLNQGEIAEHQDASLILFNPHQSFSLSHPLYGEMELFGKVEAFIYGSRIETLCKV